MYIVWWIHVADSRLCRRQYCADVRNRGLKSPRLFMSTSSSRSRSSFTTHNSLLTAHRSKYLMSNPFGEIGAICVSKNLRTLHADIPTSHNSKLKTHHSLLTTHYSKICRICVIGVPLSSFVKKEEKGILERVKKIQNYQPSYSQANTKLWKTFRKHAKKRLKCFLSFT